MGQVFKFTSINLTGDSVSINNTVNVPKRTVLEEIPETNDELYEDEEYQIDENEAKRIQLEMDIRKFEEEKQNLEQTKVLIISEAQCDADLIVQRAKEEAQRISDTATEQGANLRRTAQTEGYNSGYEDGYNKVCEDLAVKLTEVKQLMDSINDSKAALFKKYEKEILEVVMEIAEKVILDSMKKDSKAVNRMIKQAAKSFKNSEYIKVIISETDANEELTGDLEFLRSLVGSSGHIELEVMKDAPKGTVIIDNDSEITDASVSTQLKMISEIAKGKYRDEDSDKDEKAGKNESEK